MSRSVRVEWGDAAEREWRSVPMMRHGAFVKENGRFRGSQVYATPEQARQLYQG